MLIDCTTCRVRGTACGTCVVSLLDGAEQSVPTPVPARVWAPVPRADVDGLNAEERRAVGVLLRAGLLGPRPVRVPDRTKPAIRHSA